MTSKEDIFYLPVTHVATMEEEGISSLHVSNKENDHDEEVGKVKENDGQSKLKGGDIDSVPASTVLYSVDDNTKQENEEVASFLTESTGIDPPEEIRQQEPSLWRKITPKKERPMTEPIGTIAEEKVGDSDSTTRNPVDQGEEQQEEMDKENEQTMMSLPGDTYSLLLVSKSYCSVPFWYGLIVFLQQLALLYSILAQQLDSGREKTTTLNVPFANSTSVQIGQFTAIIFALFTQRDLLQSIPVSIAFMKKENWETIKKFKLTEVEDSTDKRSSSRENDIENNATYFSKDCRIKYFFWERVFLILFARLVVTLLTLFAGFVLIIQSTDIIDLVKDFTALYIIAELDNYAYQVIEDGYFGNVFKKEVKSVNDYKIKKNQSDVVMCNKSVPLQSLSVLSLFIVMMGTWSAFVSRQNSGLIFKNVYNKCDAFDHDPSLSFTQWGDGTCDPRLFTEGCGLDGGDCRDQCNTFFQFHVLGSNLNSYYTNVFWPKIRENFDCEWVEKDPNNPNKIPETITVCDDSGNRCYVVTNTKYEFTDQYELKCKDREGYDKCVSGLTDASKYEEMSNCLSDEILFDVDATSKNHFYCWFGSDALFDPNKNKKESSRMLLASRSGTNFAYPD